MNNYFKLRSILSIAGWNLLYEIEEKRKKDSVVIYYIAQGGSDSASVEAMAQELVSTFGLNSYIYEINDIYDVWRLNGRSILSLELPNY